MSKSISRLFEEASDSYISSFKERFFEQVDTSGDCHEWQSSGNHGYGTIWFSERELRAHRVSLFMSGQHVEDKDVLHNCHNRACVNPDHLRVGDDSDNQIDALKQETNPSQKLSISDVRMIKRKYKNCNVTQSDLADECGVGQDQISRIVNGKNWGWVET